MLAWLAEGLAVDEDSRVVDVGGGLGGPSAWLTDHYGCFTVCVDPVPAAARTARSVFDLAAGAAQGEALPFRDDAFDAALLLGVVSVVESISDLLREVRRVAHRLGLLVYVSTGPDAVEEGGSRFPSRAQLDTATGLAGWTLDVAPGVPGLPPPPTWTAVTDGETDGAEDAAETAVAREIADGRVEAIVAVATRAGDAPA